MKRGLIMALTLVLLLFIAGCASNPQSNEPVQQNQGNVVEITSSGFVPSTLAVNQGAIVRFVNKDLRSHWPASAAHPTHTVYQEPGGCISSKFDACRGLANGEEFSFKFDQKGTWKYHDHLNPSLSGTIIVN